MKVIIIEADTKKIAKIYYNEICNHLDAAYNASGQDCYIKGITRITDRKFEPTELINQLVEDATTDEFDFYIFVKTYYDNFKSNCDKAILHSLKNENVLSLVIDSKENPKRTAELNDQIRRRAFAQTHTFILDNENNEAKLTEILNKFINH